MSIRWKLANSAIIMMIIAGGIICFLNYHKAKTSMAELAKEADNALTARALDQLASIRSSQANHIKSFFETIVNQVKTLSDDRMIIDACQCFKNLFFTTSSFFSISQIQEMRAKLAANYKGPDYLQNPLFNQYRDLVPGYHSRPVKAYLPDDDNGIVLQYLYIYQNPYPVGKKHFLNMGEGDILYNSVHQKYHPHIRDFLETFHYYDIFIIDPDTGYIVYTVFKEKDFATSLLSGPYKDTNLARCFREACEAGKRGEKDFVSIVDFAPYEPSYNAPAAFVASPIFDGEDFIGVLAFQIPVDEINHIMLCDRRWEEIGLGKTGETYLVGPGYTMRSSSRFQKNSLLKLKVRTRAVEMAFSGQSGKGIINNYRDRKVLSAWQPLNLPGLQYVLLAEIEAQEALKSVQEMQKKAIQEQNSMFIASSIALIVVVIVGCCALIWFISYIIRPLNVIVRGIQQFAAGDLTIRLDINRRDEFGILTEAFNTMVKNLAKLFKLDRLAQSVRTLSNLSSELHTLSNNLALAANKTTEKVETVTNAANTLNTNMNSVSGSMIEATNNISSLAAGSKEMKETIDEISQNTSQASEITSQGVEQAKLVAKNVEVLGDSARQIGEVIETITTISKQTNLLALNATIEAARAGEAGKGFAVVANEIKELASQTSVATDNIKQKIKAIQDSTEVAIKDISQIFAIINKIDEIVETIAISVSGQAKTIQEMAEKTSESSANFKEINDNIVNTAGLCNEIAEDISNVHDMAQEISNSSRELKVDADQLQQLSEELRRLVKNFKF